MLCLTTRHREEAMLHASQNCRPLAMDDYREYHESSSVDKVTGVV